MWSYFKRNNENSRAQCNICETVLVLSGGATKTMADHPASKHSITKNSGPLKMVIKIEAFASNLPVIFIFINKNLYDRIFLKLTMQLLSLEWHH